MVTQLFNGHYPKAIFFDLDGTLVDSVPDLAFAVDAMLAELELQPAGAARVRDWVGNGARKLVERALAFALEQPEDALPEECFTEAYSSFLRHYGHFSGKFSRLYPGVAQTLVQLQQQGVQLVIITNKPQQFTPDVLAGHDIDGFFQLLVCGDTLAEKKPHPAPLYYAMEKLGVGANECVMVGDSASDIHAAQAAGIASICVTYGYNHGHNPRELPASIFIDHFSELLQP